MKISNALRAAANLWQQVRRIPDQVKAADLHLKGDERAKALKKDISLLPAEDRADRVRHVIAPWLCAHEGAEDVPQKFGGQMADLVNCAPERERDMLATEIINRIPPNPGTAPSLGTFIGMLTVGHDVREELVGHALMRMQRLPESERIKTQAAFLAADDRNLPRFEALIDDACSKSRKRKLPVETQMFIQKLMMAKSRGDAKVAEDLMTWNTGLLDKRKVSASDFMAMASQVAEGVKEEDRPRVFTPHLKAMVRAVGKDPDNAGSPLADFAQLAALPPKMWAEHGVMVFPCDMSPSVAFEIVQDGVKGVGIFDADGVEFCPDLALPRNRQREIDLTNAHLGPAMALVPRQPERGSRMHIS